MMKRLLSLSLALILCLLSVAAQAACAICGDTGYAYMKLFENDDFVQVACPQGCAPASACAICGGDMICDKCNGLGFLGRTVNEAGKKQLIQLSRFLDEEGVVYFQTEINTDDVTLVFCTNDCYGGRCPLCIPSMNCESCGGSEICPLCNGKGYACYQTIDGKWMMDNCIYKNCADGACSSCTDSSLSPAAKTASPAAKPTAKPADYNYSGKTAAPDQEYYIYSDATARPAATPSTTAVSGFHAQNWVSFLDETDEPTASKDIAVPSPTAVSGFDAQNRVSFVDNHAFKSSAIEDAVRKALNNHSSDLIRYDELETITELDLRDSSLSDISDLAYMTGLVELNLSFNEISDVSPLAKLKNLETLYLHCNKIKDASPLTELDKLKSVTLVLNPLSDTSVRDDLPIDKDEEETILFFYAPTATPTAKPAASSGTSKASIASNDGLLVMSPEEYLGIEPCEDLEQQDNWYEYLYSSRGIKCDWFNGNGTSNPVDWYQMEKYVNALVDSGYYKILEHETPMEDFEFWSLGYIGPGSVKRTHKVTGYSKKQSAIFIQSFMGDIRVYYSLDIATSDLKETQERLGVYISNSGSSSSSSSSFSSVSSGNSNSSVHTREKNCTNCSWGKVNCSQCNGRGYFEKTVTAPNFSGRSKTRETVREDCGKCRGFGTQDCKKCGGDGKVEY